MIQTAIRKKIEVASLGLYSLGILNQGPDPVKTKAQEKTVRYLMMSLLFPGVRTYYIPVRRIWQAARAADGSIPIVIKP
jgi:hypothetical protein